jgi:predicted acetyltransferase
MTAALAPRRVRSGEELDFARTVMRNFHEDATEEALGRWLPVLTDEGFRAWAIHDAGEVVGTYGVYTTTVSVPGGARLPAAGVTTVGVSQTHRRRGLLRAMMDAGLDEAVERGEPVALLWASESAIYPRFGFGTAAPGVVHRIDRGVTFRDPVDHRLVRPASVADARDRWPAIFERLRDQRGGCVTRSDAEWDLGMIQDPPDERGGATGRRLAHVPDRGYVAYRVRPDTEPTLLPAGEVRVQELVATDPEAEAALWQHVCDVDLTARVVAWMRPPDDAITELLADPLRARTAVGAPLYARLLDVSAAYEARAYEVEDELVIGIEDATRDQSGTYRLATHPEGGVMRPTDAEPQLTMPVEVAGSLWLGGMRATHLRAARRLQEHEPGAAARLDRALAVERLPWTPFEF